MTALDGWDNFYVMVGSSAGALIGLQFVVMTLIADMPTAPTDARAAKAFGTPNVVHFGVVLLLSAILIAPWHGINIVATLWGLAGFCGLLYVIIITKHMQSQTVYEPVFEDWAFHVLLPLTAYALLAVSACVAYWHARPALFAVGASALLLLFIGIHNAWDTVTYHVFVKRRELQQTEQPSQTLEENQNDKT